MIEVETAEPDERTEAGIFFTGGKPRPIRDRIPNSSVLGVPSVKNGSNACRISRLRDPM
jgi:hypothetical protein